MNNREKMHKILDLTLDIAERREGVDGYPMIVMEVSNFPQMLHIRGMENGFTTGNGYDKSELFELDSEKLENVITYLEKILEKATAYIQEVSE